jgi:metal-responsive CopG/Arc/MetJ family transcriptional regulator
MVILVVGRSRWYVGSVKTAISLDEALYSEADALARELQTSRSQLIALALAEFIRQHKVRQLREQLDVVYGDTPEAEEVDRARKASRLHRRAVEGTW